MCKSLLYATNGMSQTIAADGTTLNLGSVVRRFGNNITLSDGTVVVQGVGYYNIDASLNYTASGVGTVTVAIYKDGVVIPGASTTITVAADTLYHITIPATFRMVCCCQDNITIVVSGEPGTVTGVSVRVEKV